MNVDRFKPSNTAGINTSLMPYPPNGKNEAWIGQFLYDKPKYAANTSNQVAAPFMTWDIRERPQYRITRPGILPRTLLTDHNFVNLWLMNGVMDENTNIYVRIFYKIVTINYKDFIYQRTFLTPNSVPWANERQEEKAKQYTVYTILDNSTKNSSKFGDKYNPWTITCNRGAMQQELVAGVFQGASVNKVGAVRDAYRHEAVLRTDPSVVATNFQKPSHAFYEDSGWSTKTQGAVIITSTSAQANLDPLPTEPAELSYTDDLMVVETNRLDDKSSQYPKRRYTAPSNKDGS